MAFCFVIAFFINVETKGQQPPAPNGKFETIQGLKFYYEDTGKGMPLVLLHGFNRTASLVWKSYVPAFAKFYRVIAIDLPGHGRSDYMDTTEFYLHKRAAEYIMGLLDKLQIDSAYVIGISAGSFITQYMATIKPQLTKKIILIGGQVYYSLITRNVVAAQGPGIEDPETLKNAIKHHGKEKGSLLLRQMYNFRKQYGDPSFTPDVLASIKARTLIIHGDNDPLAPVTNAWEMYRNIPKASLWIVPNGGHVPSAILANRDDFMRRVLEFLHGDWEENK
jgi:pimeloyl-ACP methyl ester carboxylesterase